MGWQIIMVSFGAYAILMYLIKNGTASKTSNLFFLVPPVTAIMAYFILGEKLYVIDIFGLVICLGTVVGAAATVGIHLYFDILSFLFVLGGAIGFLVMRNDPEKHIANFGEGSIYFGWLCKCGEFNRWLRWFGNCTCNDCRNDICIYSIRFW